MESVRLKINEHMTSVGEDILCVLEKQQSVDVCRVKLDVRVFVLERLRASAVFMCSLFQREMETLHTITLHTAEHHRERSTVSREMASKTSPLSVKRRETDQGRGLIDAMMQPVVTLCKMHQSAESSLKVKRLCSAEQEPENRLDMNFLPLPLCKDEVSSEHEERSPSLVQEEPQPPHIKEEQEELLRIPEVADGSTMTLLAVKSEDDDENGNIEPLASTSTEHMKTRSGVVDCGTSQPTRDEQLISPRCSESDVTEDSDDWEETREGQWTVNTLDSHKTQNVEEQTLSSSHKLSQDLTPTQTHSTKSHKLSQDLTPTQTHSTKSHKLSQDLTPTQTHSTKSHTGKKRFSCTECGKMFSSRKNLKQHTVVHMGEKPFTCDVCGKGCSSRSHLKTHMRSHTGEKPFACKVCRRDFSQNCALKTHTRTHTGEKPFACKVCGKGFGLNNNLTAHMRTHTGEKPFSCNVCDKGFNLSCTLKRHMRTHTGEKPFTCKVCGKGFGRSSTLNSHMRTHTGKKPFSCNVCGKGFSQSSTLNSHMTTHTGEKPFTCKVCGKGFSQNSSLKTHMRTHTEGKAL